MKFEPVKNRNCLNQLPQLTKPKDQLVSKPSRSYRFVDTVKRRRMYNIPHIIPDVFVRRVVNEVWVIRRGTSAFETIRMLKESVQGLNKKIWTLTNKGSVQIANIAPILVKHATSLDLLHTISTTNILECLEYGF